MYDSPVDLNKESSSDPPSRNPKITYQGNNYDLLSVVGVTLGGVVLASCATGNMFFCCFPFLPLILGIIGLVSAPESVDPERTQRLSWISIGAGALVLLVTLAFVILYFTFFASIIATEMQTTP